MGCACNGTSTSRASAGREATARRAGVSPYEYEATYNDGSSQRFSTEAEVQAALAFKGGGYRQVPRQTAS